MERVVTSDREPESGYETERAVDVFRGAGDERFRHLRIGHHGYVRTARKLEKPRFDDESTGRTCAMRVVGVRDDAVASRSERNLGYVAMRRDLSCDFERKRVARDIECRVEANDHLDVGLDTTRERRRRRYG